MPQTNKCTPPASFIILVVVASIAVIAVGEEPIDPPVEVLVEQLASKDMVIRAEAITQIKTQGHTAKVVALLIEQVEHGKSDFIRGQAAVSLGRIGSEAAVAVPVLLKQLRTLSTANHYPLQWGLINGLMGIGPKAEGAVSLLTKQLGDDNFQIRCVACRALGEIGKASAPAAPELTRLLQSDIASVRFRAVEALGNIGPAIGRKAVVEIATHLAAKQQPIREMAVIALGKMGMYGAPYLARLHELAVDRKSNVQARAIQAIWRLEQKDEPAVKALLILLGDINTADTAAIVLGEMGPAAALAVPTFVEMLSSTNSDSQYIAVKTLGSIGAKATEALPKLRSLRESPDLELRNAVEAAINRIESNQ